MRFTENEINLAASADCNTRDSSTVSDIFLCIALGFMATTTS